MTTVADRERAVRVISKKRLVDFYSSPPGAASRDDLLNWYEVALSADWTCWQDVRSTFPKASLVGDCVVFNIRGGMFRLVVRVRYQAHKVFILRVMTHAEYDDQQTWQEQCGCHNKVPPKLKVAKYIAGLKTRAAGKHRKRR